MPLSLSGRKPFADYCSHLLPDGLDRLARSGTPDGTQAIDAEAAAVYCAGHSSCDSRSEASLVHTRDITLYQHSHVFHGTDRQVETRTLRVVWLTVAMMGVEIVAGWLFNSMALLADGWHMSTHAAALGISWLAFVLARRHAVDHRFAFGTWKIEVLGGFVSGILLGGVALAMLVVSVARLRHPVAIRYDEALLVAVLGLGVNVASVLLLRDHSRSHGHSHEPSRPDHDHEPSHGDHGHEHGHAHENLNLRAAYLHVVADALTSVLAILALLGGRFLNWNWLDPLMGIVGTVMIGRWTQALLLETGGILLDRETDGAIAGEIRQTIESDPDPRISDLHVWKVGQNRYACIVALVAGNPRSPAEYKACLLQHEELVHVTVEVSRCADGLGQTETAAGSPGGNKRTQIDAKESS
ncbi:MAG: hypothetical protein A3K19_06275 [Lentisphaerae bacterium RIFOXYB12_FULL_65_16]|nr:MAG: hypothetical protein A3K18_26770 [Lentisphaerae bacterium RIFOXYA12_64_32]OGV93228.1 MAG: hypothetical protein A3K19_06275 [Lentisphaerae bacterium RIFOXYB12_FULL_65_16]